MYEVLDDPTYDGDPAEILLRINEMLGEYDSRCNLEHHPILEEIEPDPGLFPEDTGSDITTLDTPEALNTEPFSSFSSSTYLQRMMVSESNYLVSLISSLTPCTARRRGVSKIGAGAEFFCGLEADRQFSRQVPRVGCGSCCGRVPGKAQMGETQVGTRKNEVRPQTETFGPTWDMGERSR